VVVLAQPIMLIIGGLVFAVILDGGVRLLGRVLPIGRGWRLAIVSLSALAQDEVKVPITTKVSVTQQIADLSSDLDGLDILAPVKITPAQAKIILDEVQPAVAKILELDVKREAGLVELRDALVKAKAEALAGKQPSADVMKKLAAVQKAAGKERATAADEASMLIWMKLTTVLDDNQKKAVYDMTRQALKNLETPNYLEIPQKQLGSYFTREVRMLPRQLRLIQEMIAPKVPETPSKLDE